MTVLAIILLIIFTLFGFQGKGGLFEEGSIPGAIAIIGFIVILCAIYCSASSRSWY